MKYREKHVHPVWHTIRKQSINILFDILYFQIIFTQLFSNQWGFGVLVFVVQCVLWFESSLSATCVVVFRRDVVKQITPYTFENNLSHWYEGKMRLMLL